MDAQPPVEAEVVADDDVILQPIDGSTASDILPESGSVPKWN
jgi:hypothetical protein